MEGGIMYNHNPLEMNGSEEPIQEKESDIVDVNNLHLGKEYSWYIYPFLYSYF